jgi:hypothetical protein
VNKGVLVKSSSVLFAVCLCTSCHCYTNLRGEALKKKIMFSSNKIFLGTFNGESSDATSVTTQEKALITSALLS